MKKESITLDENFIDKIKSFFFGQYFEAGLRITFGIIFPALVLSYSGDLMVGINLSIGALSVAIADLPGPVYHKRNGMVFTVVFVFLIALITGLLSAYPLLLAIEIPLFCFFFGMLNVYGPRASLIGSATLLIMMISTDPFRMDGGYLLHAVFVMAGGAWYTLLSMAITQARPYRLAQQALGECVTGIASYLRTRSGFYDEEVSIDENYKRIVLQQIIVNQQLDAVREIIFKSRKMVNETTGSGKLMIMVLSDLIDLFEYATSIPYDYSVVRNKLGPHQILPDIAKIIVLISKELDNIGYSLISNEVPRKKTTILNELEVLKVKVDELERDGASVFVMKKILINLRSLNERVDQIHKYFKQDPAQLSSNIDLNKFVSHQQFSWSLFRNNLNIKSTTFRHAVRLSIACLLAYLVSQWLSLGQHSYWILVTTLVILKPDYSLTKQRNIERVLGTIIGALAGVLILFLVENQLARFVILLAFMVLSFSFSRTNYIISVLFMTPFILILFSFLSVSDNFDLVRERILDTLIGSLIALVANYFIFPNWESRQKSAYPLSLLKANLNYLVQIVSKYQRAHFSITNYKLARKEVYVQSANLASAFQKMLQEPKRKQKNLSQVYQFLVLNNILSSGLSTLSLEFDEADVPEAVPDTVKMIRKSYNMLRTAIENMDPETTIEDLNLLKTEDNLDSTTSEDSLILDQLSLIYKTASDIEKLTRSTPERQEILH